jgi:hypothetical protein
MKSDEFPVIARYAKEFDCDRSTLSRRYRGVTTSREEYRESMSVLSNQQSASLILYINTLTTRGIPPTPAMIRNFVYDITKEWVSKNWVTNWTKRHSQELESSYLQPLDMARKIADNLHQYAIYFNQLEEYIKRYEILPGNQYNMDEKGFLIGILTRLKRVFTKAQAQSGQLIGPSQDGNREWITILACICADGTSLSPSLIYQAVTGNLQDTWLQDFNPDDHSCFFTSSPTGWTNNDLGYQWLTTVFDRETKTKARGGRDWRLLIIDGHGSHINMRFLEWATKQRILVAVYPPHSTHRLQPLDVSLFAPLAVHYSQQLARHMLNTQGLSTITKRDFFRLFWPAYRSAFSRENIYSGWRKTGIYPFDPNAILSTLQAKIEENTELLRVPANIPTTPEALSTDWRALRRLVREVGESKSTLISEQQKLLEDTIIHITTRIELLQVENTGLRSTVINEQKKRRRGKGLFEELRAEGPSQATFFSPNKIKRAQELQEQREQEKQRATTQKQQEKLQRDILRQEKQQEIEQRRQIRMQQKEARELVRAQKQQSIKDRKEAREAERQLQDEAKAIAIARTRPSVVPTGSHRPVVVIDEQVHAAVVEQVVGRPSRARRLPKHLDGYELA